MDVESELHYQSHVTTSLLLRYADCITARPSSAGRSHSGAASTVDRSNIYTTQDENFLAKSNTCLHCREHQLKITHIVKGLQVVDTFETDAKDSLLLLAVAGIPYGKRLSHYL